IYSPARWMVRIAGMVEHGDPERLLTEGPFHRTPGRSFLVAGAARFPGSVEVRVPRTSLLPRHPHCQSTDGELAEGHVPLFGAEQEVEIDPIRVRLLGRIPRHGLFFFQHDSAVRRGQFGECPPRNAVRLLL